MPKVSETYSGQYLNASELTPLGQRRRAMVHAAALEMIGQDANKSQKIVLSLVSPKGAPWPKDVVLNRTNAMQLSTAYGDDTDGWLGKTVEVWSENVMFQGRMVPGIKIMPVPTPIAAAIALPAGNSAGAELNDEIPF
jgi:hypothetical protein